MLISALQSILDTTDTITLRCIVLYGEIIVNIIYSFY